ncbi:MAG: SusC/RagA family TonB-linked outer membrane protein [Mucilaginibacter sp.]|nr:SusC/RagA family TonB-linked outer membrane protein [Mucilaginibacter sp.]
MKKYLLFLFFVCFAGMLKAQTIIHGKVTDAASRNPLFGATISAGNGSKTISDSTGQFAIKVGPGQRKLIVSFTGYFTADVDVKEPFPLVINIALKANQRSLDEVVVSTGYQKIPQDRATGSFSQVDNHLFDRRVSNDVMSRLEGVVPGLLFNRNTADASNGINNISIRGTSTIFANSQPLVVVDGFPYDGDINNLNPNSVESITVLKDAAAASIWGVKSGNGVIVITTKQGSRNNKMVVDFNSNLTIGVKPNLYYNPNFLNANDFINVEQKLFSLGYYDSALSSGFNTVSPVVDILAKERAGTLAAQDASSQINALRNIDVRNDLTRYFYQHSIQQQYALSLSGGGNNFDYFVSGGYDNDRSNQVGNKGSRATLNSSLNFYPVKQLLVSVGLNYAEIQNTTNSPLANINGGGGYGAAIYPYAQLVGANGSALPIVKDFPSSYTDTAGQGKFYDWKYRPLDELRNADNTSNSIDNRINLSAKYDFLKGFSAEAKYEYENQRGNANNYYSDQTYYTRNLVNEFTENDGSGHLTFPIPRGGILQSSNSDLVAQRGRFQLNYIGHWNAKNDLSVIAGAEVNQTITTGSAETLYGYDKNTLTYQNVDYVDYFQTNPDGNQLQIPNSLNVGKFTDRYVSYYSNAGYTFDGKYTASLSGRIDKSNLFGVDANQKSVPLYSTGLAWEFSREGFYKSGLLPYGKIRITYGYNGNTDKTVTALTTFQQVSNSSLTGNPFAIVASPGNPELRWERDRIFNFAYDFASKNQVFSGSIEYYLKRGYDLIGSTPLAPSTGFSTIRANSADIKGNGFDISLYARLLRTTKFQWQSNLIISHVLDIVTKYDAPSNVPSYLASGDGNGGNIYPLTNKPLYAIYSYKWAGLTHDTGDPQGYLNGQVSADYAAIISGTTTNNMFYNGPSRPTTFGSFRNTFSYDQFSLSFNIIYKLNYYFRRSSISYGSLFSGWIANKDFGKGWQKPGDELTTNVPSIQYPPVDDNRDAFYEYSSTLVDKGDHIRLQDISLSYDLVGPKSKLKTPFTRLSFYSYINNVGILWKANHDGLDPDLYSGALPVPRTISFGVKATLK